MHTSIRACICSGFGVHPLFPKSWPDQLRATHSSTNSRRFGFSAPIRGSAKGKPEKASETDICGSGIAKKKGENREDASQFHSLTFLQLHGCATLPMHLSPMLSSTTPQRFFPLFSQFFLPKKSFVYFHKTQCTRSAATFSSRLEKSPKSR